MADSLAEKSERSSDPENGVIRPINTIHEGSIANFGMSFSDEEIKSASFNLSPSFRPPVIVSTQNSPSKISISEAFNMGANESVE